MDNLLGVTLADYQVGNFSGAGEMSAADLAELTKALSAGQITGRETANLTTASGAPLKVESLENTLKVLEFKEQDLALWQKIPKLPAYNTVEEYNQLQSYGTIRGGFNNEGELPEEEDSIYVRRAQLVKFMGTTRSVSHPMQLVNTMIGNVIEQETKNGTLWLLRLADAALTKGDADLIPQQFNGILKQHFDAFTTKAQWYDDSTVIDLQGQILTEKSIEDASLAILQNHGIGDLLMAPPSVLSNFVTRFYEAKFIQPNTPALTNASMGQKVNNFVSQFGNIDLGWDKFMIEDQAKYLSSLATSTKAPTAPVADATTPKAAQTSTTTKFGTAWAGDYYYAVSASNRYGESALTDLSTAGSPKAKLTLAATEVAELKFADGGGAVPATMYTIYRSKKNPAGTMDVTPLYPIFKITTAQKVAGYDGGAAGLVWDINYFLPGTEKAFLIENSTEIWSFKQLAPLMKMDLAVLAPAIRFMILLYGTPMLYAPKKMVQFINIGTSLT